MAICLTAELQTLYTERLAKYEARLILADTYYEALMSSEGMESLKFDSGEAMSWAKYTDPSVFLQKVIYPLEAWIDHYRNKLNGTGIVKLNLRRKRRGYYGR